MKVYWTETAASQLDAIYRYIAIHSESYAKDFVDRITGRSIQIGLFPFSGRSVSEFESTEIREVFEGPYRIVHRVKSDQIDVLAVLHGAMRPLSDD